MGQEWTKRAIKKSKKSLHLSAQVISDALHNREQQDEQGATHLDQQLPGANCERPLYPWCAPEPNAQLQVPSHQAQGEDHEEDQQPKGTGWDYLGEGERDPPDNQQGHKHLSPQLMLHSE